MTEIQTVLREKITPGKKIAVMGVGSVLRSDDGAGMYLIERLTSKIRADDALLIAGSTAPENFTGVIKTYAPDILFVADAAHMGMQTGEISLIRESDIGGLSFSTHMLPLPILFGYLKLEADCEIVCIGIQPENTEQGLEMCGKVRAAVEKLADLFDEALRAGEIVQDKEI